MKAVGVVVEYNPFHNGHAFHLQQSRELTGADVAIAVMSGNFLQRGEPALLSKWARTSMALAAGVDLVFELPYRFATQKAEIFAEGAVSILTAAGCSSLCFGSESGDLAAFDSTIEFLEKNQASFQDTIKQTAKLGYSYPKAISLSYQSLAPAENHLDISSPNNILGLHYMQAIRRQGSPVKAVTVPRKNAGYHDEHFSSSTIASATSIRKALMGGPEQFPTIKNLVPSATYEQLIRYREEYGSFHSWENYWPLLKYKLLQSSPADLKRHYEVEEGLEHRLSMAAASAESFQEFMSTIKTKRYTWTRLQRVCVHILTNTIKEEMKKDKLTANYLRLLGASERGRQYLKKEKENFSLPIVSKLSAFNDEEIALDIRATTIYALGQKGVGQQRLLTEEYSTPPLII